MIHTRTKWVLLRLFAVLVMFGLAVGQVSPALAAPDPAGRATTTEYNVSGTVSLSGGGFLSGGWDTGTACPFSILACQ